MGILVLLLLVIEACMLEIRNPLLKNLNLFSRKRVATMLLLLLALSVQAQSDRDYVRRGNKQFRLGSHADAEVDYRKALEKNNRNPQAIYNLGNALMAQKKDSAAIEQFQLAAKTETNPLRRAMAYHNIGVICQGNRMYGEAIEAYKEALRNNPNDDETRYNLELCKRQRKNQQDKQDQKQQQQKQDKQDQQKQQQEKEKQKQEQQQQQEQKPQMSKENAEQLLNAAMQEEKNTQERIKKAQHQKQSRRLQKNW